MLGFSNWEWIVPNHITVVGLGGGESRGPSYSPLQKANLCELVDPMPKDLVGITIGIAINDQGRFRYRNKRTGELWAGEIYSRSYPSSSNWDRVNLTDDEVLELESKYGAADWCEWSLRHWGTSGGTYWTSLTELHGDGYPVLIEFHCAECPPNPETMRKINDYLGREYLITGIKWIGYDPFGVGTFDVELD